MADTQSPVEAPVAPPAPAPAAPPPSREQRFEEALKDAFVKEGIVKPEAKAPEAPPAPAPVSETKQEPPALAKIARQMAEFRKEREQAEPYMNALKVLPPDRVTVLAKALSSRDPVSALTALGFSHAEYTNRLLDGVPTAPAQETKPDAKTAALPPELAKEFEELRAFKQRLEAEDAQKQQATLTDGVGKLIKANPKFKYLSNMENYTDVLNIIGKFHADTGRLPGDTFDESVLMAAEHVEAQLAAQAEKWRKVLTPAEAAAKVEESRAPESPATGTETPRSLTNANTSAPAAVRPVPKTRDERIAALLADPLFNGS